MDPLGPAQPITPAGLIGRLVRHAARSRWVAPRPVDVWLPDDAGGPYPVIYMYDGQNLFDPATAYGGVDWGMDEAVSRLAAAGRIPPAMVVGVWHGEQRWREAMPQKALPPGSAGWERSVAEQGGGPASDDTLRFLVEEVKPAIDRLYPTLPGRETTLVMGSSMGGLLALYALCEQPEVFGGAGCLSTHWPAGDGATVDALATLLPRPGRHRLYFDHGDGTLDALYERYQRRADRVIEAAGYRMGHDWLTRVFAGAEHNEAAWRGRVHLPLEFLLTGRGESA